MGFVYDLIPQVMTAQHLKIVQTQIQRVFHQPLSGIFTTACFGLTLLKNSPHSEELARDLDVLV